MRNYSQRPIGRYFHNISVEPSTNWSAWYKHYSGGLPPNVIKGPELLIGYGRLIKHNIDLWPIERVCSWRFFAHSCLTVVHTWQALAIFDENGALKCKVPQVQVRSWNLVDIGIRCCILQSERIMFRENLGEIRDAKSLRVWYDILALAWNFKLLGKWHRCRASRRRPP